MQIKRKAVFCVVALCLLPESCLRISLLFVGVWRRVFSSIQRLSPSRKWFSKTVSDVGQLVKLRTWVTKDPIFYCFFALKRDLLLYIVAIESDTPLRVATVPSLPCDPAFAVKSRPGTVSALFVVPTRCFNVYIRCRFVWLQLRADKICRVAKIEPYVAPYNACFVDSRCRQWA